MARTKQTARKAYGGQRISFARKGGRGGKGIGGMPVLGMKSAPGVPMAVEQEEEDLVDTQQFIVKFDDQAECEKKAVKNEFLRCKDCEAILTAQSKILSNREYQELQKKASKERLEKTASDQIKQKYLNTKESVWICEFCATHNEIDPKFKVHSEQNPCFQIENLKKKASNKNKKAEEEGDGQILIFCIDISSSMEDKINRDKLAPTDKLNCVKEAIIDELRNLRDKGTKKVGIVTFGSEVTILGDGTKSNKLHCNIYDFDDIVKAASGETKGFSKTISQSYDKLRETVDNMRVNGSTALGPALLASTAIASKGALGSKVIICTDGEANTGIGAGGELTFYDKMAQYAKDNHVTVSVLTIKGANCNVKTLGRVSSATRGSIMKVDPTKLGTEFSKIISDEILGVDSEVIILLNKRFKFRGVDSKLLTDHDRILRDKLGNFSADTELTYSFDVIPVEQAMTLNHVNLDLYTQKNLPMQVQLTYTGLNGNKYLQVFTDWREMTTDESALFQDANFGVFAASCLQKAAKHIRDKEFDQAQKVFAKYRKLCEEKFSKFKENSEKIKRFNERIDRLEKVLRMKMSKQKGGVLQRFGKGAKFIDQSSDEDQSQSQGKSRSRSRSRGGTRGRGGSTLAKSKKKTTVKKRKEAALENISSDEADAVLYEQMAAHQESDSD